MCAMDATAASPAHAGPASTLIARRDVGRHLTMSVPATTIIFALLGPLLGGVIAWVLLVVIPTLAAVQDLVRVAGIIGAALPIALATAYAAIAPAATTGAVVALLSPFSVPREQFMAGVASTGAFTAFTYATLFRPDDAFGTPLFISMMGAGTAILCTMATSRWPLMRTESRRRRRDRLARERAARLKAQREGLAEFKD
jgi:hypothetical protein